VDLEQAIQLHGLSLLHQFPSAEDDDVVCGQCPRRLGHARHGRLAGDKGEGFGGIAAESFEGFGEDGPKGQAEGAVKGGHADLKPGSLRHGCEGGR